jgi:glycosyltransferase involved in cell wall biosynthesis
MPWMVPPERYGGLEIAVDGLCRGMSSTGVEVFLWSHPGSTCPVHRGAEGTRVRSEDGWHDAIVELRHVLAGYRWLLGNDVQIVHDLTLAGPFVGPAMAGVPVVTTSFLPFYPPSEDQTFADVSLIYERMCQRVPVLAVSQGQASRARGPVAGVIHLGTEVDQAPPGPGDGDERGEYALFLGRMAPEKGVVDAINAAREAGVRLKIAAQMEKPAEIAYYRELVEPLLDGELTEYVGEPTLGEKLRLLQHAAVLVNPITWEEPFGLVMIEALAAGTPVIARRGGSVEEIIVRPEVGTVCDTYEDVVKAISARAAFSRNACRAVAEERFSYSIMTDRHLAFYESVLRTWRP